MEIDQEYFPNITPDEMFWGALQRKLPGADSNVERFVLAVATRWIAPDDFVVDLGANHGQHARVLASSLDERGRLLVVEADPALAADLALGASRSGVKIEVVNAAVGDADMAALTFFRHPLRDQEGSLFRRESSLGYEEMTVAGTSLDSLMAGRSEPSFIKIDVEGAEFSVLRGGREFLSKSSPLMTCELSYDSDVDSPGALNYTMRDLFGLLAEVGWSLYRLDGQLINFTALQNPGFRLHYQSWLVRDGSAAESYVRNVVPGLASAFGWGATSTPPYPFHLDKHPVRSASA